MAPHSLDNRPNLRRRLGDEAPDPVAIARAFGERQVPLHILSVADPAITALYERRLVLVRPDGHVAWRSNTLPPDPRRAPNPG